MCDICESRSKEIMHNNSSAIFFENINEPRLIFVSYSANINDELIMNITHCPKCNNRLK